LVLLRRLANGGGDEGRKCLANGETGRMMRRRKIKMSVNRSNTKRIIY